MKRMIWTVVFRDATDSPQQEIVRYTEEAANGMAKSILKNGGVAIVIEGDEDIPLEDGNSELVNNSKGGLVW